MVEIYGPCLDRLVTQADTAGISHPVALLVDVAHPFERHVHAAHAHLCGGVGRCPVTFHQDRQNPIRRLVVAGEVAEHWLDERGISVAPHDLRAPFRPGIRCRVVWIAEDGVRLDEVAEERAITVGGVVLTEPPAGWGRTVFAAKGGRA